MQDPLKRRYQVFVSSTYRDLVEERQRVMMALLETKCIPLGMELFPATSLKQLEVIKPVIDDSDYYLLIIAGKYGSMPLQSDLSFTEFEFDYAIAKNKSIIVFCHKDIDTLPGAKLEHSDVARTKLEQFRLKATTGRTCTCWTTPSELESRVKSAILYAIEHDPQPGWVRLTDVSGNTKTSGEDIRTQLSELKADLARTRRSFSVDGPSTLCVTGKGLDSEKASVICDSLIKIGIIDFASTFIGPEHVHFTFPSKTIISGQFIEKIAKELMVNIKVISDPAKKPGT